MAINMGEMDTLVTLQKCEITYGSEGEKIQTYTDFRRVYANVDRRVSEQVSIGNLEDSDYITLTIYKVPELTTRWRVVVDDRAYEITGMDLISRISPFCTLTLHALD